MINHYRTFDLVPPTGSISTKEVAAKCGLPNNLLCRILRQAMSYGAFTEPEPENVAHTTLLKAMARMSPLLTYQLEVCLPSSLHLLSWLRTADREGSSAFQIAHDTTDTWWDFSGTRPELLQNYGQYMALITNGGPHDVCHVVNGYAWGDLGKDAIVVDVGFLDYCSFLISTESLASTKMCGADGFVGIRLAEAHQNPTVPVQDNVHLKERADGKIPAALRIGRNYLLLLIRRCRWCELCSQWAVQTR